MKLCTLLVLVLVLTGCAATSSASCTKLVNPAMFSHKPNKIINLKLLGFDVQDGDVICFEEGVYNGILIADFAMGNKGLIVKPSPDSKVILRNKKYSGTGIKITNSNNVSVQNFFITSGMYGVYVESSSNIAVIDNVVTDIGQHGIVVKSAASKKVFSNVLIANNMVSNTGARIRQYGEGIYIGNAEKKEQGLITDVTIIRNSIDRSQNEAIDIKGNTRNVQIIENRITNTNLKFNGAITIAVGTRFSENAKYFIEGNLIVGVKNRSGYRPLGIVIGQGNAKVFNNIIIEDHKSFVGICLFSTFTNQVSNLVEVKSNTVITKGMEHSQKCGDGGSSATDFGKFINSSG
jgi:parallel beta-helix repeat protein